MRTVADTDGHKLPLAGEALKAGDFTEVVLGANGEYRVERWREGALFGVAFADCAKGEGALVMARYGFEPGVGPGPDTPMIKVLLHGILFWVDEDL